MRGNRTAVSWALLAIAMDAAAITFPPPQEYKRWYAPVLLGESGSSLSLPAVAANSTGSAVAVWRYKGERIYASRCSPAQFGGGCRWGPPVNFPTSGTVSREPVIALDPGGNALVVWTQWSGIWKALYTNWLTPAGWQSPLQHSYGRDLTGAVAMGANGDAWLAWAQDNVNSVSVHARRCVSYSTPPTCPNAADLLGTGVSGLTGVALTVLATSDPIVVYTLSDGSVRRVLARYQMDGSGNRWEAEELLDTAAPHVLDRPAVAGDANLGAVAAWVSGNGTAVHARRFAYNLGFGWTRAPDRVGSAAYAVSSPCLGVDDGGSSLLAWESRSSSTASDVVASRHNTQYWSAPHALDSTAQPAVSPHLAMNSNGTAFAVWRQYNSSSGAYEIYARRFTPGSGWDFSATLLDSGNVSAPQVAVFPGGDAVAVWARESRAPDGTSTFKVYARNYQP